MADIPGIIEGASEGRGLGLRFLRHIERNSILLFLIPCDTEDIRHDYEVLLGELQRFNPGLLDKHRVLAVTKCDLIDEELISMIRDELPSDIPAVFISAPTGYGLTELKDLLWREMNSESNKLQSISDSSSIVHRDMDVRNIQADFSEWDAGIEVVEEGAADEEDWDEDEVIEV